MTPFSKTGMLVDVHNEVIYPAEMFVEQGHIRSIRKMDASTPMDGYILPGFIDSHVHIESSMLVPSEFARLAVVHGTVATVSDPHEIANVCGGEGVHYMIKNGRAVNFKFFFGAPSCVPATSFETAGARIDPEEISSLLSDPAIKYLSEMMNFPGVIDGDPDVLSKIGAAHAMSKPIDGHAPALTGERLVRYIGAGISTDHECVSKEEALEKLSLGMKIIIREGSAAKNFDALIELLDDYADEIMFCSDDKHPDSLVEGHINELCRRAVDKGIDIFKVLKAACINPVNHYSLDVGTLRQGEPADFILVNDLRNFRVKETYVNGVCVASNGKSLVNPEPAPVINRFFTSLVSPADFAVNASDVIFERKLPVIEALDGQIVTRRLAVDPLISNNIVESEPGADILKLVVVNRYAKAAPAVAFIKSFGLKKGAIASSVAHDSHNIIAVGSSDDLLARAVQLIMNEQGGISATDGKIEDILPLPVAGLMSTGNGYEVAAAYTRIDRLAKSFGCTLSAPYMTLSFMALLVIPSIKLSDLGLFDGEHFRFVYNQQFTD
jgi:adenine deaminase